MSAPASLPAAGESLEPDLPMSLLGMYLRLVAQLLGLAMPIAMMLIIDKVVSQGGGDTLTALVCGVALLTLFQYAFLALQGVHALREVELAALALRLRVWRALLGSAVAARWAALGWDVVQSAAEGGRYRVEARPQMAADCVYVGLLALLMAAFSPALLAVSAGFVPLYVIVEWSATRMARQHGAVAMQLRTRISGHYQETLGAAELVRGMNLTALVTARWSDADQRLAATNWRGSLWRRMSTLGVELLQKLALVLVMLLGVARVIDGEMTLGQYIAFNLLSMQLAQPVLRLAAFRRAREDHAVQRRAQAQLIDACAARPWPEHGDRRLSEGRPLTLDVADLVPGHGTSGEAVSFVLREGQWLAVTGASGCGKTTLLQVIAGIAEPVAGVVRFNGVPVGRLDPSQRARLVCLVPQSPSVFSGSLADNLLLGDPDARPEDVLQVAALVGLGPLLARLPRHLDTLVGAAGQALSGGEAQRLAIGRALLSRPRMLLLDEATAGLDAASEATVLNGVRRFLPEAAVVIVSHRASSLAACTAIVRLDQPNSGVLLRGPGATLSAV